MANPLVFCFPRLTHEEQYELLCDEILGKLRRWPQIPYNMRNKKKRAEFYRNAPIVLIGRIKKTQTAHWPNDLEKRVVVVPSFLVYFYYKDKLLETMFSDTGTGSARHWVLKHFPPTVQELENQLNPISEDYGDGRTAQTATRSLRGFAAPSSDADQGTQRQVAFVEKTRRTRKPRKLAFGYGSRCRG